MNPALLALLLIVNLLTCPVRCLSHEAKAAAEGESTLAHCACCEHCDTGPVSDCPEPCGDGCDCENCICEGAVLETDIELSAPMSHFDESQFGWFVLDVMIRTSDPVVRDRTRATRQFRCGRELLVAHQSWLL